jgi:hypothetical protein
MGNIKFLANEKRNDFPFVSLTNSCYLVLSHLHGVYPPKINPFSDLTSKSVGDLPTQQSLKDAL